MKPIIYKDWELYTPPLTEENQFHLSHGAKFMRNKDGKDWYELRKELEKQYTDHYFVIVDDRTNLITNVCRDISGHFPYNDYIVIMESIDQKVIENPLYFKFKNGKIVSDNTVKCKQLEIYISEEISWASSMIGALEDISLFGEPTEEEKARLLALRKYRFILTRIVPEDNPDIDLPDRP